MKRVIYILFLFAVVIIPSKAFAISGKVNLNCSPASAFPGDSVTCTIAGDVSDGSITEFAGTTTLSDNLEFGTASSSWTGPTGSGMFTLKTSQSQTGSFEIVTFTVKIKDDSTTNGTVTIKPTKLGDVTDLQEVSQTISMSTNVANNNDVSIDDSQNDTNVDIKNPETGSSIPFIIISCISILTVAVYQLASKKKKIYKI